ncbi:MAG: tetratricopeptide repeat protein [Bacteroidota bacterium]
MIRFILLVFLVFGTSHSTAQKKNTQAEIDSFALNKLNSENLEDFRKLLEVDNKFYGWSRYYANKAYMLYKKNKTDSAKRYADSALSNFTRLKKKYFLDEESLLKAYMTLGYIYRNEEQYEASTTNFLNALEIERKYPYPYKSYIVGAIANNHLSLGNNERAINLYQQNLKDSLYISFPRPHVVTLTRLGVLYSKNYLNHKDSAYHYFKKAENISLATNYLNNRPKLL